jgi:hypothetical protein
VPNDFRRAYRHSGASAVTEGRVRRNVTPGNSPPVSNAAMLTAEISYEESYEGCPGEEAAHPYCHGGERPSAARGPRALFDSEPDFELISASLLDVYAAEH